MTSPKVCSGVHIGAPTPTNLRLDTFERLGFQKGIDGSLEYLGDFYLQEFWRFVFLQQEVGKYAQAFIEFPPMQEGRSSNLDAVGVSIVSLKVNLDFQRQAVG